MRMIIQRVTQAAVQVAGETVGEIGKGYLVLLGVAPTDTQETVRRMVDKMLRLRIFSDQQDKINLSLQDVGGSLLIVSQFTLYADCRKGNRPSFVQAAPPDQAKRLYEFCLAYCRQSVANVQAGIFGADMQVSLCNDGPFTVMLDSDQLPIRK